MKNWQKGFLVAIVHVLIVLTLGGKLLYDRAHRPRVWVRTAPVDPDLPIRGRYLTLSLQVHAPGLPVKQPEYPANAVRPKQPMPEYYYENVELSVMNGELMAHKTDTNTEMRVWRQPQQDTFMLTPSVAFFVPEHAETPRLNRGDELWAEVTIPRKGPPRPIQLAVKRGTQWTPLNYR